MKFICLLLLLATGGEYLYFNNQLDSNRRKLIVLSKENSQLKNRVKGIKKYNSLSIKFSEPLYSYGEAKSNSLLYLSPLETSPILCKMNTSAKIKLLCTAEVLDEIWYEVLLDSPKNINSRGWMKKDFIIINEVTTTSINFR